MATFDLSEVQAEAILNMRLRALRKLEEEGIRKEHDSLSEEQSDLKKLLEGRGPALERDRRAGQGDQEAYRAEYGARPPPDRAGRAAGRRGRAAGGGDRARAGDRALLPEGLDPGHEGPPGRRRRGQAQGRRPGPLRDPRPDHRQASDLRHQRPLLHHRRRQAAGRPGLRRAGAPDDRPAERPGRDPLLVHQPGRKLVVASSAGRGFVVPEDEVLAQTKNGKQVLNLGEGEEAIVCSRSRATASRWSARTASCWSSPWRSCPR